MKFNDVAPAVRSNHDDISWSKVRPNSLNPSWLNYHCWHQWHLKVTNPYIASTYSSLSLLPITARHGTIFFLINKTCITASHSSSKAIIRVYGPLYNPSHTRIKLCHSLDVVIKHHKRSHIFPTMYCPRNEKKVTTLLSLNFGITIVGITQSNIAWQIRSFCQFLSFWMLSKTFVAN